jgi:acyl-CoA-binding protein
VKSSNVTDNNIKLKIYSLYKQAIQGDCNIEQPQIFDFVGRSKWNAWNGLKGMKKT